MKRLLIVICILVLIAAIGFLALPKSNPQVNAVTHTYWGKVIKTQSISNDGTEIFFPGRPSFSVWPKVSLKIGKSYAIYTIDEQCKNNLAIKERLIEAKETSDGG